MIRNFLFDQQKSKTYDFDFIFFEYFNQLQITEDPIIQQPKSKKQKQNNDETNNQKSISIIIITNNATTTTTAIIIIIIIIIDNDLFIMDADNNLFNIITMANNE